MEQEPPTLASEASNTERAQPFLRFVEFVMVAVSGIAIAGSMMMTWIWTDGYPAEYYDAGNRAAFAMAWVFVLATIPFASIFLHYVLAWSTRRWCHWIVPSVALAWVLALFALELVKNCSDVLVAC